MAYTVPLADILKNNGLTIKSIIYVGQKIIIRAAFTPTPTQPTATPTIPAHNDAMADIDFDIHSDHASSHCLLLHLGLPIKAAGGAVAIIVVSALVLAGLIALIGRKRN